MGENLRGRVDAPHLVEPGRSLAVSKFIPSHHGVTEPSEEVKTSFYFFLIISPCLRDSVVNSPEEFSTDAPLLQHKLH